MIIPTLSALLLVVQYVSAMPFAELIRRLPPNVIHVAFDEENGQYMAYDRDGSLQSTYPTFPTRDLGQHKRAGTSRCGKLSVDEAKLLPGFKQLEAYADKTWGTGKRKVMTNPTNTDQRGGEATACVSDEVVQVEFTGSPNCNSHKGHTDAKASGTNGSITSTVAQGYSTTGDWSVKTSSTIGISSKVSATFKIPEIAEVGAEVTTSGEFTSEAANGFSTTSTDTTNTGATFAVPSNKKCYLDYDVKTCTVAGQGKVRYVAGGWVWFEYEDKVQEHYKWAASIEQVITNEDDRSSFMEFAGAINGTTTANFDAKCE